jgi:predicted transglutaminase-like cysteine proteinase
LPSNIIINLPSDIPSNFEEKITTMVIEHNSDNWLARYGLLKKYEDEFGTVDTITIRTNYEGVNIGDHVSKIRQSYNKGTLPEQRITLYNKLNGWTFTPYDDQWNEGFKCLKKYYKQTGHTNVPQEHILDGLSLGIWCGRQRTIYNRNTLSSDRIKKLKEINFRFNPIEDEWNNGFNYLKEYYKREGNSNVSSRYSINGFNLGTWVVSRRGNYRDNILSKDKIKLLKSLKFIFNPRDDSFSDGLNHLADYFKVNNNSNVPLNYEINNFKLGKWCAARRTDYRDKRLSKTRIKQLEKLNFKYDLKKDYFGEGFKYLKVYFNREKTSNVTNSHVEDGFRLGNWCTKRRTQYRNGELSDDKVKLLKSVNFIFDPLKEQGDTGLAILRQYHKREGSSNVPSAHIENGFKLGHWVGNIRQSYKKGKLDQKKISQLKKLGFSFDVLGDQWNKYFAALLKYYKNTKRSNPPEECIQDGLKLGQWVSNQRYNFRKNILSKDRIKKLESIDFEFNPKKK